MSSVDWNGGTSVCTATVTGNSNSNTPAGSVAFSGLPANAVATKCNLGGSNNIATCSVTYTAASGYEGSYSVTASYSPSGDSYNQASVSSVAQILTVTTGTTTTIDCAPSSIDWNGGLSTCTGTVTADDSHDSKTPSGVVAFSIYGYILYYCSPVGSGNVASCGLPLESGSGYEGTYSFSTSYFGDSYNLASGSSTPSTLTITTGTTTAFSCPPPNNIPYTGSVTGCTVTVTNVDSGYTAAPEGVVSFTGGPSDFTGSLCTLSESGTGTSSCTFAYNPVSGDEGAFTIYATFTPSAGTYATSSDSSSSPQSLTIYSQTTFQQAGISGSTWGVTVGGTHYTGTGSSITVNGLSATVSYTYDSPVAGSAGTQYVCASGCSGSVSPDATVSASYGTQYYLTVNSAYGSPTGENWYDAGATASSSVTSPVNGGIGTQYVTMGFSGTGDAPPSGPGSSVSFTINQPSSVTWNWKTQYDLQFTQSGLDSSAQGTIVSVTIGANSPINLAFGALPHDFGYVDSGTIVTYAFTSPIASTSTGERFVSAAPSPSPSSGFSLSGATTVTGTFKTQYLVQFAASPSSEGTVSPSSSTWYDSGSSGVSLSASVKAGYIFLDWTLTCNSGSGCLTLASATSSSTTFSVGGAGMFTANFITPKQALNNLILTVNAMGLPNGITGSLDTQLQQTIAALNKGHVTEAVNDLNSFMTHVNDLKSEGVLTSAQALTLTSQAQTIIGALLS